MPSASSISSAEPLADPVESQATHGEQLKQLRRQLLLKQFELDTVLGIAHDMTARDHTVDELYHMLRLTLQGQRNVVQLLMFALEDDGFRVRIALGCDMAEAEKLTLSQHLIEGGVTQPQAVEDLHLPPAWDRYELVIPIMRQKQVAAYVFVGGLRSDFDRQQLIPFLGSLTNTLIGAVENHRLQAQRVADAAVRKEIEIAQEVQAMLFPRNLPNDSHLAIERSYVPHTEIGGDYYDVVEIDEHRLLLCVADVSGKGVPASLLMSNFQAGLRTLLRQGVELATIVPELNHLLFRNSGGEKFITAFLGIYDRRTRHLHYVNAGHNDPLLITDNAAVQTLKHGTVMLGIMEELPLLRVGEIHIPAQSLLLLYTDGLTEVFDAEGNEFGEEGVLSVLQRNRYLPLPKLHQELLSSINAFSDHNAQFADDVTILSCRFK
ncbi:PP2C family protein-serine/threonine phosphatase [Hymenobacter sp. BT770]|uniref:PP2C family protein-serine/threonine phosphatase n=1 Tax=Hymenobacter sp. BT770 TaxID=2886942 RepID=UPI001D10E1E9|nr:PP2C family protein-serine/threonine phosphatase [Hymenobacter sp. BT770]MCC3154652.1 PP2C family protein-serine/threonine phosphatase [Hymenobacter sp. BT770]MDO3416705.1 PP2C family protein-serine/threonine phosphatase [Hymenobacter sp. BT770]